MAEGRKEIVHAAARAFMTNIYPGSSIDSVAKELGCTKGRIYYEYKAKADLFFDVQDEAMQMNIRTVAPRAGAAGAAGAARERLRRMLEEQLQLVMTQQPFQRVLVRGVEMRQMHLQGRTTPQQRAVLDRQVRDRNAYEKLYVKVLVEGVKRGKFRAVKPRIFVKVLLLAR